MKNKNWFVSRAQALGALTYASEAFNCQVNLRISPISIQMDLYGHSLAELVDMESKMRAFCSDGCSMSSGHEDNPDFYWVTIEWPFPSVYFK